MEYVYFRDPKLIIIFLDIIELGIFNPVYFNSKNDVVPLIPGYNNIRNCNYYVNRKTVVKIYKN